MMLKFRKSNVRLLIWGHLNLCWYSNLVKMNALLVSIMMPFTLIRQEIHWKL